MRRHKLAKWVLVIWALGASGLAAYNYYANAQWRLQLSTMTQRATQAEDKLGSTDESTRLKNLRAQAASLAEQAEMGDDLVTKAQAEAGRLRILVERADLALSDLNTCAERAIGPLERAGTATTTTRPATSSTTTPPTSVGTQSVETQSEQQNGSFRGQAFTTFNQSAFIQAADPSAITARQNCENARSNARSIITDLATLLREGR